MLPHRWPAPAARAAPPSPAPSAPARPNADRLTAATRPAAAGPASAISHGNLGAGHDYADRAGRTQQRDDGERDGPAVRVADERADRQADHGGQREAVEHPGHRGRLALGRHHRHRDLGGDRDETGPARARSPSGRQALRFLVDEHPEVPGSPDERARLAEVLESELATLTERISVLNRSRDQLAMFLDDVRSATVGPDRPGDPPSRDVGPAVRQGAPLASTRGYSRS
jgi:hypothetical protein